MPLIALTGGIASGKSTIARRLADRGAVVVDVPAGEDVPVVVGVPADVDASAGVAGTPVDVAPGLDVAPGPDRQPQERCARPWRGAAPGWPGRRPARLST